MVLDVKFHSKRHWAEHDMFAASRQLFYKVGFP